MTNLSTSNVTKLTRCDLKEKELIKKVIIYIVVVDKSLCKIYLALAKYLAFPFAASLKRMKKLYKEKYNMFYRNGSCVCRLNKDILPQFVSFR